MNRYDMVSGGNRHLDVRMKTDPMKITIVTGPFYPIPPGPAGSVEKIWTRLAQEFVESGHDVTIVSRKHDQLPLRAMEDGIRVIRVTKFSRTGSRVGDLFLEMCYALRVLPSLPKSDIIVTNTIFLPIFTAWMPNRVGKTVVSVERFPKKQLNWYRHCARLRTTSMAVDRAAREQSPGLQDRIRRIPNPVDLRVFAPPASRPDPREGTILYAGRIHPEKGLETLVKAFVIVHARFPGTKLTLIGPQEVARGGGGPEYLSRLNKLGHGLPITLLPNTDSPKELADHLRNASVFCYPSVAEMGESFPVAPLEAMATGLPCVLSTLPVFEDLLQDGVTGLSFNHKSDRPEEEVAVQLERLLIDNDLRHGMEIRGAAKASEYGYDTVARAFLHDFHSLIGETRLALA